LIASLENGDGVEPKPKHPIELLLTWGGKEKFPLTSTSSVTHSLGADNALCGPSENTAGH